MCPWEERLWCFLTVLSTAGGYSQGGCYGRSVGVVDGFLAIVVDIVSKGLLSTRELRTRGFSRVMRLKP